MHDNGKHDWLMTAYFSNVYLDPNITLVQPNLIYL